MTPETQPASVLKETPVAGEAASALSVAREESASSAKTPGLSLAALSAKLLLQLDLRVPFPSFRVQNLLSLEKGQVIESAWPHTEDLPLWSGGVHLVWTEFEVVDQKLAVRVTRLV